MERLSRHSDEAQLDPDGKPVLIEPNSHDIEKIFRHFARYRRLRPDTIAALNGASVVVTRRRMKQLTRQPNKYFVIPDGHYRQPFPNSRFQIYELSERGIAFMKEEGLHNPVQFGDEKIFDHSPLIYDAISSIQIGAQQDGRAMVWWPEIIASKNFPEATRKSGSPTTLPVTVSYDFPTGAERVEYHYTNDTHGAFGVEIDGKFRFFSLEAENKSYIDRTTLEKPSFLKKFLSMREIERKKLYAIQWGLPNLLHLVVCTSQSAIDARKALIMRETNGKGCTFVAFAVVPSIQSIAKADSPRPRPELFTQGWQRAGHPDVFLNAPLA